jgi:hypothetical protein
MRVTSGTGAGAGGKIGNKAMNLDTREGSMPIIQKCGQSGVELHEIRRNVNADGEDTTSKGKPTNGYTDGRKGTKIKGFNANRPRSCGVGMGPAVAEVVAKGLLQAEKRLLISVHKGKSEVPTKLIREINNLAKKGLVEKTKDGWTYTYEGDQVVRKLKA